MKYQITGNDAVIDSNHYLYNKNYNLLCGVKLKILDRWGYIMAAKHNQSCKECKDHVFELQLYLYYYI